MPSHWLPLLLCLAGLGALAVNSWRSRRAGVDPWALPAGDDANGYLARCYFWLVGAALLLLFAWALAPAWSLRVFGALPLLLHPVPAWIGITLILAGFVLALVAQKAMGDGWRIGIPRRERLPLVTRGPFRFSRNPAFLGILLCAFGLGLAIPHALSVAVLAATSVALSVQVRLEEAYLEGWLGAEYLGYKARTGRWLSLR